MEVDVTDGGLSPFEWLVWSSHDRRCIEYYRGLSVLPLYVGRKHDLISTLSSVAPRKYLDTLNSSSSSQLSAVVKILHFDWYVPFRIIENLKAPGKYST